MQKVVLNGNNKTIVEKEVSTRQANTLIVTVFQSMFSYFN